MRWDWSVEAVRRSQLLSSFSGFGAGLARALIGRVAEVGIWFVEAPLWWDGRMEGFGKAGEDADVVIGWGPALLGRRRVRDEDRERIVGVDG